MSQKKVTKGEKQEVKKIRYISISLVLITTLVIGIIIGRAQVFGSTIYIMGGVYPGGPSYTVWVDGTSYYAKDSNGQVDFSGTNASYVVNEITALFTTGGEIFFCKGTYYFTSPILVQYSGIHLKLEKGTIFYNNVANDYLIKVGRAAPRINDFQLTGGYISAWSLTEKGFLYFYNTVLDYVTDTVFRYCAILDTWAINITSSWEIFMTNVQIFNVQNGVWLGGAAGYFELINGYINAWDYGALGATRNYAVYLANGGFYCVQSQLEGGAGTSTNGVYIAGSLSSARFYETTFESFNNYDLNVTNLAVNNPSGVYGGYINGSQIHLPAINRHMFSFDSYRFQNSGVGNITASTFVVFNHGLWGVPLHVDIGWQNTGWGDWRWRATTTQINITVSAGGSYNFTWRAYYKPLG